MGSDKMFGYWEVAILNWIGHRSWFSPQFPNYRLLGHGHWLGGNISHFASQLDGTRRYFLSTTSRITTMHH